ncbi:hypothetical protein M407DRAFT_28682 [Tulasnella calospora MUT 4182]|uniref:Protein kinase domain-containing protein n=1 Tax=Tulasnella calospora MUT 4182 TaxID=1051891 RepID=A0A0C3QAA9_9AGAM|nr:hypothetical protein M407DRAFT_28682 [Tulasnella calospora MUT 4182]
MENDESRPEGSRSSAPRSDNEDSAGESHLLNAKLMDKLEQLAQWRISPSSIAFPKKVPEFSGGFATVSRGLLPAWSYHKDRMGKSNGPGGGAVGSNSRTSKSSRWVLGLGGDKDIKGKKKGTDRSNIEMKVKPTSVGEGRFKKLLGRVATSVSGLADEWATGYFYKAVAVKKMEISGDTKRILRLTLREAGFLVEVSHPNIIKLVGFVEDISKNMIWLVFPWEENGTLRDFVASANWEIPERISLICDFAEGVEYLHSQEPPIYHGDLKSINVLVNSECLAVITDFGSAGRLTAKDLEKGGERTGHKLQEGLLLDVQFSAATKTMTLTGDKYTLRWAAPELLNGDAPGLWSDIWALGWVGYEVMMNSIPFENVSDGMVVRSVIQGDVPAISNDDRMMLIQALCSLLAQCWNLDPTKRPTAPEFRAAINWMATDAAHVADHSPELLMQLGRMHASQNDYPNASKYYAQALTVYTDLADGNGKAGALVGLAQIRRLRNDYNEAIAFYSESLQIWTEIGDRHGRADALFGLAEVHRARDEYNQAVAFYSEDLQIRTEIGDRLGRADALWGLAEVHRLQNEYNQAIAFYSEDLQIRTEIGDRQGRADALFGLAEVHRARDEYNQAVAFYSEDLQIRTEIGDRQGRADALWGLAEVHRPQNEYNQAIAFYSEDLQIRTEIGDRQGRASALWGLAEVHRARNEYNQAVAFYSESLQIRTEIGDRQGRASALLGLAEVHQLRNGYSQAIPLYSEALQCFTDIGDRYSTAFTLRAIAHTYRDQDDHGSALHHYEQAAELFKDIGHTDDEAESLKQAANIRRLIDQAEAT